MQIFKSQQKIQNPTERTEKVQNPAETSQKYKPVFNIGFLEKGEWASPDPDFL